MVPPCRCQCVAPLEVHFRILLFVLRIWLIVRAIIPGTGFVGIGVPEVIASGIESHEDLVRVAETVCQLGIDIIKRVIGRAAAGLYQPVEQKCVHSACAEGPGGILAGYRAFEVEFFRKESG